MEDGWCGSERKRGGESRIKKETEKKVEEKEEEKMEEQVGESWPK